MSQGPQETALDKLLAYAEGYVEFSMRKLGRVHGELPFKRRLAVRHAQDQSARDKSPAL